jgi:hypothetical protein
VSAGQYGEDVVGVHVVNAHELHAPVKAEAVRHTVTRTFNDIGQVLELLQQDTLRVQSDIFVSGAGNAYICHSYAQAQAALTGVGGNFGALVPCPGAASAPVHWQDFSQAKMWVVLTGASPVVAVISQRKAS